MSTFIDTNRIVVGLAFAKWCRVDLYGLHYDIDIYSIIQRDLMLDALEINETYDIFSDDTVQCLQDKVQQSQCNC